MNLEELRAAFPALEHIVYLNTPTAPPGATPVLDALRRAYGEWESGEFSWQGWEAEGFTSRGLFAGLIGVPEESVALLGSVAEGASTVAASLPKEGRVVLGDREFHSNSFPWLALRERGIEVAELPSTNGCVSTDQLLAEIDEQTSLVTVSEVQSSNGYRVDVPALAARCAETGTRLFVNVTQSLGALRFDAAKIRPDFVACHGYKWLLGPRGAAWLHVRDDRAKEVQPLLPSWHSLPDPYADYYGGPLEIAPGARGLDTPMSWFPWLGARAALELISSLDAAEVEKRCLDLSRSFREAAGELGLELVPEELPSQTVGVHVPDPDVLRTELKRRKVIGAVRGGYLRLGFHAFNNASDVEEAVAALRLGV